LRKVAAGGGQQVALGSRFDAFGDHPEAQLMRHHDDRFAQRAVARIGFQAADEGAFDFEIDDVEFILEGER
jgi:hypothetical protein